jgi:hypothetical protein
MIRGCSVPLSKPERHCTMSLSTKKLTSIYKPGLFKLASTVTVSTKTSW